MKLRTLAALPFLLLPTGSPAMHAPALECDVPIRWQIAEVDERFGLSVEEAARAVREAGLLWQEAVGHRLLFQESDTGMAVRFVFDERQEATVEYRRLESEVAELAREAEAIRAEFEETREELEERRMAYETRSAIFRNRLTAHNREVEEWNEQGGAPPQELPLIQRRGEELDRERERLNEEVAELNRMTAQANEIGGRLNRIVAEHDRAAAEMEARFGGEREEFESGRYRETRRAIGGWVFSIFREIEIYQFDDENHLVLVLAHELGHALGLEHSDVPGSVMAATTELRPDSGRPRLHRSDVAQLREVCFPLLGARTLNRPGG